MNRHAECHKAAVIFVIQIEAANVVLYIVDPHPEPVVPYHEGACPVYCRVRTRNTNGKHKLKKK